MGGALSCWICVRPVDSATYHWVTRVRSRKGETIRVRSREVIIKKGPYQERVRSRKGQIKKGSDQERIRSRMGQIKILDSRKGKIKNWSDHGCIRSTTGQIKNGSNQDY